MLARRGALDALTFQVDLEAPAAHFLILCYTALTLPTPQHAIQGARRRGSESSWTAPGSMVSSGPFLLKHSRPYDCTVVCKNPRYFDAALVGVEEIEFVAADGATVVNLFRAGEADSMDGRVLPLQLVPDLRD